MNIWIDIKDKLPPRDVEIIIETGQFEVTAAYFPTTWDDGDNPTHEKFTAYGEEWPVFYKHTKPCSSENSKIFGVVRWMPMPLGLGDEDDR